MNHAIKPGPLPPVPGLDKEEPELATEDDIPRDDDHAGAESGTGRPDSDELRE
jgi:hypothetical protein